jgi:hypothetical protein
MWQGTAAGGESSGRLADVRHHLMRAAASRGDMAADLLLKVRRLEHARRDVVRGQTRPVTPLFPLRRRLAARAGAGGHRHRALTLEHVRAIELVVLDADPAVPLDAAQKLSLCGGQGAHARRLDVSTPALQQRGRRRSGRAESQRHNQPSRFISDVDGTPPILHTVELRCTSSSHHLVATARAVVMSRCTLRSVSARISSAACTLSR